MKKENVFTKTKCPDIEWEGEEKIKKRFDDKYVRSSDNSTFW